MGAIIIFGVLGAAFYFLVVRAPDADIIFRSASSEDLLQLQKALEETGIKTYTKNLEHRNLQRPGIALTEAGQPSLHVVNVRDRAQALLLIGELGQQLERP